MDISYTLFLLIAAHFVCDFPLQSEAIAINKNRNCKTLLQNQIPYYYWLFAHAITHGLAVALITKSFWLAVCETICHYCIDYYKCEGEIDIGVDQSLHIACKFVWIVFMVI